MPEESYHRARARQEREFAATAESFGARSAHLKLAEEHAALAAAVVAKRTPETDPA